MELAKKIGRVRWNKWISQLRSCDLFRGREKPFCLVIYFIRIIRVELNFMLELACLFLKIIYSQRVRMKQYYNY
jgi:hypothetical protein